MRTNLFWSLTGSSDVLDGQSRCVAGKDAVRRNHLQQTKKKYMFKPVNIFRPELQCAS